MSGAAGGCGFGVGTRGEIPVIRLPNCRIKTAGPESPGIEEARTVTSSGSRISSSSFDSLTMPRAEPNGDGSTHSSVGSRR